MQKAFQEDAHHPLRYLRWCTFLGVYLMGDLGPGVPTPSKGPWTRHTHPRPLDKMTDRHDIDVNENALRYHEHYWLDKHNRFFFHCSK